MARNSGYVSLSALITEIESLIEDWEKDADTNTAEFTLVQIQQAIDKKFMRPQRQYFKDENND